MSLSFRIVSFGVTKRRSEAVVAERMRAQCARFGLPHEIQIPPPWRTRKRELILGKPRFLADQLARSRDAILWLDGETELVAPPTLPDGDWDVGLVPNWVQHEYDSKPFAGFAVALRPTEAAAHFVEVWRYLCSWPDLSNRLEPQRMCWAIEMCPQLRIVDLSSGLADAVVVDAGAPAEHRLDRTPTPWLPSTPVRWKVAKQMREAESSRSLEPGRPFHERYTRDLERRAREGISRVLGEGLPLSSWRKGRARVHALVDRGLRPVHTVVDHGCGSLRVGRFLIDLLEPGRYWGLDVAPWILETARANLAPDAVAEKRPHLHVIDADVLGRARDAGPDWILSLGVAQHVPPSELEPFFAEILAISSPKTRIGLSLKLGAVTKKTSWKTWSHSREDVERLLRGLGAVVESVVPRSAPPRLVGLDVQTHWVEIRRPGALETRAETALYRPGSLD